MFWQTFCPEKFNPTSRMGLASSCGQGKISDLGDSFNRPVCDLSEQPAIGVSQIPDQRVYAVDALLFSWENLQAYAYSPTSILTKVMEKVRAVNCCLILIAPAWPSQPWYTDLLDLSIEDPLRLPLMDKLLKQTGKNMFHSNPG